MEFCVDCKSKPRFSEVLKRYFCNCKSLDKPYHRERLNPEDAKVYKGTLPDYLNWCDPTVSVCDSPNSEYK